MAQNALRSSDFVTIDSRSEKCSDLNSSRDFISPVVHRPNKNDASMCSRSTRLKCANRTLPQFYNQVATNEHWHCLYREPDLQSTCSRSNPDSNAFAATAICTQPRCSKDQQDLVGFSSTYSNVGPVAKEDDNRLLASVILPPPLPPRTYLSPRKQCDVSSSRSFTVSEPSDSKSMSSSTKCFSAHASAVTNGHRHATGKSDWPDEEPVAHSPDATFLRPTSASSSMANDSFASHMDFEPVLLSRPSTSTTTVEVLQQSSRHQVDSRSTNEAEDRSRVSSAYRDVIQLDQPRPPVLRNANEYIDPSKHLQMLQRQQHLADAMARNNNNSLPSRGSQLAERHANNSASKSSRSQSRGRSRFVEQQTQHAAAATSLDSKHRSQKAHSEPASDSKLEVKKSHALSSTQARSPAMKTTCSSSFTGAAAVSVGQRAKSSGSSSSVVITRQPRLSLIQSADGSHCLEPSTSQSSKCCAPGALRRLCSSFVPAPQRPVMPSPILPPQTTVDCNSKSATKGFALDDHRTTMSFSAQHGKLSAIYCRECGKCRCAKCTTPRRIPSCWACSRTCLLSCDAAVDVASCVCCVNACFYHISSDSSDSAGRHADSEDALLDCSKSGCCRRWTCLGLAALLLPCIWCYLPLRGCADACEHCYARCHDDGCHCAPHQEQNGCVDGCSKRHVTCSPPGKFDFEATSPSGHSRKQLLFD